jgi:3-oxoacyl-(acyl-carrier-protein) synthase
MDRIVITGMGTVNPLGLNVAETWRNITEGVSGVGPLTLFDHSNLGVHIACEVKNFNPENYMEAREARRRDRFEQFASAAAQEAIKDSGLDVAKEDPGRIGIIVSSAIGGLKSIADAVLRTTRRAHAASTRS